MTKLAINDRVSVSNLPDKPIGRIVSIGRVWVHVLLDDIEQSPRTVQTTKASVRNHDRI